jgi:hypothetical protein
MAARKMKKAGVAKEGAHHSVMAMNCSTYCA